MASNTQGDTLCEHHQQPNHWSLFIVTLLANYRKQLVVISTISYLSMTSLIGLVAISLLIKLLKLFSMLSCIISMRWRLTGTTNIRSNISKFNTFTVIMEMNTMDNSFRTT